MTTATAPTENGQRMTLDSIRKDVERKPDRILLVGTEGVGKTTFAADAPDPVFICAEDGIPPVLRSVPRFPTPRHLGDVKEAIRTLATTDHEFKALVVDTVDWLEPIVWADVCHRRGWLDSRGQPDIEKPGYGKGYVAATDEWRALLEGFDVLRRRKGMEIILLAHAQIKSFQNPAGEDYNRYELKLNKGAAALLREWCDVNLFAVHEEFVREVGGKKKGVSTGRRVIHTERAAAWDAKNRYSLPSELPLNYADYAEAREAGVPASSESLMEEAEELIKALGLEGEDLDAAEAWIKAQQKEGPSTLARAVDRLRSKVSEKEGN